jgi:hypothetical protein
LYNQRNAKKRVSVEFSKRAVGKYKALTEHFRQALIISAIVECYKMVLFPFLASLSPFAFELPTSASAEVRNWFDSTKESAFYFTQILVLSHPENPL